MRALITRPRDDAARIADPLRARGCDILLDPLLDIGPAPDAAKTRATDLEGVQALVFSSANGVRAFVRTFATPTVGRTLRVYAVGDTTARVAAEAGFSDILVAEGDVVALAALIRRDASPTAGPLVHVTSTVSAGDLAGRLAPDGFQIIRWELYHSHTADSLAATTRRALKKGKVDVAFFYSPRTATTFAGLVRAAGLTDSLRRVTAYALSPNVAQALGDLPFAAVRTAVQPSQDALLSLFDADQTAHHGPTAPARAADPRPTSSRPTRQGGLPVMTERSKDDHVETPKGAAASPGGLPQNSGPPPAWGGPGARTSGGASDQPWTGPGAGGGGGRRVKPSASPEYREKARKGRGGGCVLMLLLLVFAALALPGSWSYWRHQLPAQIQGYVPDLPNSPQDPKVVTLTDENATLKDQVATLEGGLASLEGALAEVRDIAENAGIVIDMSGPLDTEAAAYLNKRVEVLESRIDDLRGSMVNPSNVLSLNDRLTDVEAIARQTYTRRNAALALLLAVGQLREAVDRGDPYASELKAVAAIADGNAPFEPLIATLDAYAGSGLMSRVALRARFAATANAVTRAVTAPKSDSWIDRTLSSLAGIVTLRRIDDGAADEGDPMVLLARAESRVMANDLAGAAMVLEQLDGPAAVAAQPWVQAVAAKMVADAALSDLTSLAVAEIGAARAAEPDRAQNTEG